MKTRVARQKGMAIISAVLVAALVASITMVLAARAMQWFNQVSNRQNLIVAQTIAYAAIDLSRLTIRDDMRNNKVDHLKEPWNLPIPEIKVEQGVASGQLHELQGRFNLGAMVIDGQLDQTSVDGFAQLCSTLGFSKTLADKLVSAVKEDAEAKRKAGGTPVFPFLDVYELARVDSFNQTVLQRLEPYVTILPEKMPVNVNFASAEVIQARAPSLSTAEISAVLSKRTGKYFETVDEFITSFPENLRGKLSSENFTIQSQYFLMEAATAFDRVHVRFQAMLYRKDGATMPDIIWARRNYGNI